MPSIYDTVTDKIVAALESGVGKWQRPWSVAGSNSPFPFNVETKQAYRGINVLMLWCAREVEQYTTNVWGTYKQWAAKGAQVRKGEKSTSIVFWKPQQYEKKNSDGESETVNGMIARGYAVFNADQVDGYSSEVIEPLPESERIAFADDFFRQTEAEIRHGGGRAFYSPSEDFIQMPMYQSFKAPVLYYSTLAHESVHWTGAKKRCDRTFGARFGDEVYAMEELVAELGAAFLCAMLGLDAEPREDHAQYLASWLRVLKSDSKAIFMAASRAQKAIDYLSGLQHVKDEMAA